MLPFPEVSLHCKLVPPCRKEAQDFKELGCGRNEGGVAGDGDISDDLLADGWE